MNNVETLITIFVFGLGMSFLVAKGIWEARDFHQREMERANRKRAASGKGLRDGAAVSS